MDKRFFWVNHRATAKHELGNGYIWSPKRNRDGRKNITYDNLLKVRTGDIIFSYARVIGSYGIAKGPAYPAPKPDEFGSAGDAWNDDGWRVDIDFHPVNSPIKPSNFIKQIAPFLPIKNSPIRPLNGHGNQSCYLAEISADLGLLLFSLTKQDGFIDNAVCQDISSEQKAIEEIENNLKQNKEITETVRQRIMSSRIGQGYFRQEVIKLEPICRVTKLEMTSLLRASHIKPWRNSTNEERLDPHNGLMLAPHVDLLFDQGWISFTDDGDMLISEDLKPEILLQLGLKKCNVGPFSKKTAEYLAWHRQEYAISKSLK